MPVILIPDASTAGPWPPFGTVADIQAECGSYNLQVFGDPDATNDPATITGHIQNAGDFAVQFIQAAFYQGNCVVPDTFTAYQSILTPIFAGLAAWKIYKIRGLRDDKNGKGGNAFQTKYDWSVSQLSELLFFNRGGFDRTSGYSDAPTSVGRNGVVSSIGIGCYGGFGGWPWRWGW